MNTPPPFEYPAADAREFFVPCEKDDPKREEFWCLGGVDYLARWRSIVDWPGAHKAHGCGQRWRKKIAVPDGWAILPPLEIPKRGDMFFSMLEQKFSEVIGSHTDLNQRHGATFIRRIPPTVQPAPKADLSATHRLKCWPEFFAKIRSREKRFEARKNDRDFRVGDTLLLLEWNPQTGRYTGEVERARVSYMLAGPNFGVERDYCVMSLEDVK